MHKLLIIGLGHVGKALAQRMRDAGVQVVGTTTTPAKVEALRAHADQVHVASARLLPAAMRSSPRLRRTCARRAIARSARRRTATRW
jgi:UDP-N-acetyl-D-mannosaminuronate dehydrogenase